MRRTAASSNTRWNPDDIIIPGDFGGFDSPSETRPSREVTSRRFFMKGGFAAVAAAALGGTYVSGRDYAGDLLDGIPSLSVPTCDQPEIVFPVLIDGTHIPLASDGQVAEIRKQLMDIAQTVPRGGVIEFHNLNTSEFSPTRRVSSDCQPGRPDERVWWRESKHQFADGFENYLTNIRSRLNSSVVSVEQASETPLVQGITEVFRSCRERFPRALIHLQVCSDCLQHEKQGPSAYVSDGGRNDLLAQGRSHPLFQQEVMSNTKLTLRVINRGTGLTRYGKTFDEQQSGMMRILSDVYGELTGKPVSVLRIT